MQPLNPNASLAEFQNYVKEMKIERGFNLTDKVYECLLMGEEMGELFKAVRKGHAAGHIDPKSHVGGVAEELADVFIFLLSLANMHGIDLEQAFRDKEEINEKRKWNKNS